MSAEKLTSANFKFLVVHDRLLDHLGALAERYFADDPSTSLVKLRQFGEVLAQRTAARAGLYTSTEENQVELLARLRDHGLLTREISDWKAKYQEPVGPERPAPAWLPQGWAWATLKQTTSLITDGEHQTPERSKAGVLLLSARNVHNGYLDLSDVDHIPQRIHEQLCRRLRVQAGDVLLSCSGSVGRSCVVPSGIEFSLVRSAAILRPVGVLPEVMSYALRSPFVQEQIVERKTQTAQSNLFLGRIEQLVFPVPPVREQGVILRRLQAAFAAAESVLREWSKRARDGAEAVGAGSRRRLRKAGVIAEASGKVDDDDVGQGPDRHRSGDASRRGLRRALAPWAA